MPAQRRDSPAASRYLALGNQLPFRQWREWRYRANLRRQILDSIPWRGDEQVLDVGCGSGLLLNGAARRLMTGKAIGIDLWAAHSGGDIELLWKNARLEKVADRIEFKEVDARQMPFASETFDVVVSSGRCITSAAPTLILSRRCARWSGF